MWELSENLDIGYVIASFFGLFIGIQLLKYSFFQKDHGWFFLALFLIILSTFFIGYIGGNYHAN